MQLCFLLLSYALDLTHTSYMRIGDKILTVCFMLQVLAVRYKDYTESYTKLFKAPNKYPGFYWERVVLELKGEYLLSCHQWVNEE